ncbi:MAG: c-type cytochrome biogenesis protein CcsB [Nitrospirota bacterium]|nr:c-type cytochrome biogenesis protein CcsB [Nitrospirota bacterium]
MDSSVLFGIATIGYMLSMVAYISYLVFRKRGIGVVATGITVASFVAQTAAFLMRWVEGYEMGLRSFWRPPVSNLYESLIFFVWCLILGYLVIEFKYRNRSFGAFITPVAGLALAFIEMTGMSKEIQPLMPALQSNWLLAHVTMSFIAYAAFGLSFGTALMYLIEKTEERTEPAYIFWTVSLGVLIVLLSAMGLDFIKYHVLATNSEVIKSYLFRATFKSASAAVSLTSWIGSVVIIALVWRYGYLLKRIVAAFSITTDLLDELTYKTIAVGFPIFTLGGLIFGAIWADQAWGVYWSWDPKETWSLITWFVYAFYLHARLMRGWKGRKVAVVAVVGFVTVVFTYLGVNLLLSGLHSYGALG